MRFVHDMPGPRVVFGAGSLHRVAAEAAALGGERVLLVAGSHSADARDVLAADLGARLVGGLTGVTEHVPVEVARAAVAEADRCGADLVVALGGGSATGLAKAVARERRLPVLAVPTTYAGSEMTSIWGLTDGTRKTTGRDPRVLPRTVVYDPDLTHSLSPSLTAVSGMNAVAHCVEATYSSDASPLVRLAAVEAVRALADALPRCVREPGDSDARALAAYGAWLAGIALGNATMGIHHKLCHVLGGAQRLPHGGLHAVLLPYAAAYNREAAPEPMAGLAAALGAEDAPTGLWELAGRIGAPRSLAEIGFDPAGIDDVAATVVTAPPSNPRPVDAGSLRSLLLAALVGNRPDRSPVLMTQGAS
ncbi:maleylacetate reductase [Modestobacter lapidis]|nr:maleylacetate reductase [Modestobacter lapidis]